MGIAIQVSRTGHLLYNYISTQASPKGAPALFNEPYPSLSPTNKKNVKQKLIMCIDHATLTPTATRGLKDSIENNISTNNRKRLHCGLLYHYDIHHD